MSCVKVKVPNKKISQKIVRWRKRKLSIKKKIKGSGEKPRVSVFRSNRQFSAQAIDDDNGTTIVSVSSCEKELKIDKNITTENVAHLGKIMGERLKEKNIASIVFDRNGYKYHGIVKAFADNIRVSVQF